LITHEPTLEEFAGSLSRAADWRRENMPEIETPQGYLLLVWLLKHMRERRPLGRLYKSSQFSEPTMRKAIKAFTARGLAIVEFDENDSRCRFIRGTPKLTALAEEYSRLLVELASWTYADSDTTNPGPCGSAT
jgi:DNA-binding MarR family transcriptional regulator